MEGAGLSEIRSQELNPCLPCWEAKMLLPEPSPQPSRVCISEKLGSGAGAGIILRYSDIGHGFLNQNLKFILTDRTNASWHKIIFKQYEVA